MVQKPRESVDVGRVVGRVRRLVANRMSELRLRNEDFGVLTDRRFRAGGIVCR